MRHGLRRRVTGGQDLEGYKVYQCDSKERIGGVAIWVKDSIASRESGDIYLPVNSHAFGMRLVHFFL